MNKIKQNIKNAIENGSHNKLSLIAAELELMYGQVIKHGDNSSDDDFDEELKKQYAEEDFMDEDLYVG